MTFWLTVTAALGAATMGGIFFAFSSFVIPALGRIPPAEGIRAMQRINIDVFHWTFMGTFFGTPVLCVVLGALTIARWPQSDAVLVVVGAVLHVLGCFAVTAACNVPRNNWLAKVEAEAVEDPAATWAEYASGWTRWNHVRTAACMASACAFVLALASS